MWLNGRTRRERPVDGVTDVNLLRTHSQLQIDFLILREQQEITEEMVDDKVAHLERGQQGEDGPRVLQQLKKALRGRGSMKAVKHGRDGVWSCEDQSVLRI